MSEPFEESQGCQCICWGLQHKIFLNFDQLVEDRGSLSVCSMSDLSLLCYLQILVCCVIYKY